jgi:hypothetical protein
MHHPNNYFGLGMQDYFVFSLGLFWWLPARSAFMVFGSGMLGAYHY